MSLRKKKPTPAWTKQLGSFYRLHRELQCKLSLGLLVLANTHFNGCISKYNKARKQKTATPMSDLCGCAPCFPAMCSVVTWIHGRTVKFLENFLVRLWEGGNIKWSLGGLAARVLCKDGMSSFDWVLPHIFFGAREPTDLAYYITDGNSNITTSLENPYRETQEDNNPTRILVSKLVNHTQCFPRTDPKHKGKYERSTFGR